MPYPFYKWENSYHCIFSNGVVTEEGWAGGCNKQVEDGAEVYEGECIQEEFYNCDAEGEIEYEVLAYAELPRKYQNRVLYRVTMIDPDGNVRASSKCHTVTETKFRRWIESYHSPYPYDYDVEY